MKTREVLFGGGAGGGKSRLGCYWLIKSCLTYPDTRWLIGRSVLKNLKGTTLKTFFEVCKDLGLINEVHYRYHQQRGEIQFSNKSEIVLKDLATYPSDPNFDSLGSLEITGAFIDECSEIDDKAKEVLLTRIRHKLSEHGLTPKLLMTCNPSKGWVYYDFYAPSVKGILAPDKQFIQALAADNPFIDPTYIENLKSSKLEATKQRLLYGNWDYDDDPTALFDFKKITDCFSADHVTGGKNYLTCDIAMQGSDKFVICQWNGMRIESIYSMDKCDSDEIIKTIRRMMKEAQVPASQVVYDADGMGSFVQGMIKGAQPFNNNAKPMGKDTNYQNLKTQCYYKTAELVEDGKIYISVSDHEREQISQELGAVKTRDTDKDGKLKINSKDEIRRMIGRSPDYADAIMMRMYFELKPKRSKPTFLPRPDQGNWDHWR